MFVVVLHWSFGAEQPASLVQSTHVLVVRLHCSPVAQPPVASQSMQMFVVVLH
jgi:hypothetical protein